MNSDTELIFPMRLIPDLRDLRGKQWQELIDYILSADALVEDELGISLLMVRMCSCNSCNPHSFRAMRGCTVCSTQTLKRYRGTDEELIREFHKERKTMAEFMNGKKVGRSNP